MKGFCGEEVEIKEWKQGISVACDKRGDKWVSYPNIGPRHAIRKLCNICRFSPYNISSEYQISRKLEEVKTR